MPSFIKTDGYFRGSIVEYGLEQSSQSRAVAIQVRVQLEEYFRQDSRQWVDCRQQDAVVMGWFWVLDRNGRPVERVIADLRDHAGWDGTFAGISNRTWRPPQIQFDVRAETYNGQTRYRIGFLQSRGSTPGTGEEADGHALDAQFGAQMRAILGHQGHAAPAPPPEPPQEGIPF